MFGLLTNKRKHETRSETAHLNGIPPLSVEPPSEWYEVALCERDDETGELMVKKVRQTLEPDITFTEDDGLDPRIVYTAIYRKIKFDQRDGILFGTWSGPTRWGKPHKRSE